MTGNVGVHCVLTLVKYTKKTRTFQKTRNFSKTRTFQKIRNFKNT